MASKQADPIKQYENDKKLRKEDVQLLLDWTNHQPHLPNITELQTIIFLHSRCYSIEAAKSAIDNFFTIRTICPEIFHTPLDESIFKITMDSILLALLPQTTPEGYRVIIGKLMDTNPNNFHYNQHVQLLDMCAMWTLFRHGINNGFCVILDMDGFTFSHFAKTNINTLRKGIHYLQEAVPVKIVGVHFVNVVYFMDKIMALLKRFMKGELFNLIHVHSKSMDTLFPHIPKTILPKEYGGDAPSVVKLHESHNGKIIEDSDFFDFLMSQQVKEELRSGKPKNPDEIFGLEGTFKTLQFD